jgi:hypothetical protein
MQYQLTKHARDVLEERHIEVAWVERALFRPELILPDLQDSEIERRFCRIQECQNRVLRVAVNVAVVPLRVVSVFFDRAMRGKL